MTDVVLAGGSPDTREVLRALLRLHHYRVKGEAKGLKEVKKLLGEGLEGILVIDVDLTDGSWEEVVQAAHEARPAPRVVLVSPFYGGEFQTKARRLGASSVLVRPFEIPELLEALNDSPPT